MKDRTLMQGASSLSEETIERFLSYEEKIKTPAKSSLMRYLKIAAVACVALFILPTVINSLLLLFNITPSTNDSYFILKAYAANGELCEIDVNGILNSVPDSESEKNMFGVDFPLFKFYITLSDENNNRMTFSDVYIRVYRNGKDVMADNDKQTSILYYFPSTGYDLPSGFCVMGWSEEPTDLTINIIDHKTDEIIESFMLNICFIHDSGEYLITVNEIKINHTVMYEIQKYLK